VKNTFGHSVCVTLFGESHGGEIGAVLDGIAPGIRVSEEHIRHRLTQRRPQGAISTARAEQDDFRIISGLKDGVTTGAPLTVIVPNADTRSRDYDAMRDLARPGHADLAAHEKYHGYEDGRGGGHFSGRLTTPLVALGAIALDALAARGIRVGTHISRLAGVCDRPFADLAEDIEALDHTLFPVLDAAKGEEMQQQILLAREACDSVGGVLECAVIGMPAGVGEPWFDTVESLLSHAMFSIPAVKGVEFGDGFALAEMRGSLANDPWRASRDGATSLTNHNGGINGGITNGMPIIMRVAVKPTPTIAKEQLTVNLKTGENATIAAHGRHDPAIVHRARAVVDALVALTLCDLLALRYGTDFLSDKQGWAVR
jgi:chorismate synthase